jgi:hypothetical protein
MSYIVILMSFQTIYSFNYDCTEWSAICVDNINSMVSSEFSKTIKRLQLILHASKAQNSAL